MLRLFILSLLVSCATTGRSPQSENYWDTRIRTTMEQFDSMKVPTDKFPISDQALEPEEGKAFVRKVCIDISIQECEAKYLETLHARLGLVYSKATSKDVEDNLRAQPTHADNYRFIEMVYIHSHNYQVDREK